MQFMREDPFYITLSGLKAQGQILTTMDTTAAANHLHPMTLLRWLYLPPVGARML